MHITKKRFYAPQSPLGSHPPKIWTARRPLSGHIVGLIYKSGLRQRLPKTGACPGMTPLTCTADKRDEPRAFSFHRRVGGGEQCGRNGEAERLWRLEIDDKLEF